MSLDVKDFRLNRIKISKRREKKESNTANFNVKEKESMERFILGQEGGVKLDSNRFSLTSVNWPCAIAALEVTKRPPAFANINRLLTTAMHSNSTTLRWLLI